MWIADAFAQTAAAPAAAASAGPGLDMLVMLVLMFVVLYFLMIRPQQKKAKQHREMISGLRRSDRVVTAGGILGTVAKVVDDQFIDLEIADKVRVRVVRGTITEVLSRSEPTGKAAKGDGDAEVEPTTSDSKEANKPA